MGGNGKRGGDRVLESRHLVSLFLGVVLLCAVFFTLGYVMGHNQYGGPVHASDSSVKIDTPARPAPKPKEMNTTPASAPAPANNEWDFYAKNNNNHIDPVAKPTKPTVPAAPPPATVDSRPMDPVAPAPSVNARTVPAAARFEPPKMFRGSVVLQIAAVTHESDALAMADVLQQKHFPSFVVTPTADNFFRVQVGPYPDQKTAEAARGALDRAGFKAIIKR